MKRCLFMFIGIVIVLTPAALQAEQKALIGNVNFAVKMDYICFTDDHFGNSGNSDDGLYMGLEGYGKITPNVYLGGEIGSGVNLSSFGERVYFLPIELNLKYAKEAARNLVVDFGAGLSYSSVEIQHEELLLRGETVDEERDDWLFGGQVFADLTYKINWFSIGVNGKYQITEDFKNEGFDLSNYRLGMQLGIVF